MASSENIQEQDNGVTVNASSAKALTDYLLSKGCAKQILEEKTGLLLSKLDQPDHRIPLSAFHALWYVAETFTQDPAIGLHIGEKSNVDEMGVIGHIFFNNATLGDALTQFERLYKLVNAGMRVEFNIDDDLAYLNYICESPDYYSRANMDRTMAISIVRARSLIHATLKVEYVSFAHPKPDYAEEYERIFQCPIKFDQAHCTIALKKQFLTFELPKRNPYLHKVLTRHVETLLNKIRPKKSLSDQVKRIVSKQLAKGDVDAEMVAAKLCMSRHTLYRKLKTEGHAFQALIESVRKEKAIRYIKEKRYSLSEIAFLLGFSELSAFSRAFKRWTGTSPAKYGK
ncbi:AraC family transcriptional regulator [Alkalimarinus alittae]|uniref:AraC family transcriptional regulator n=1 Tax=Alkalimarinus alittae TaxID=2961619 RepID=A0ABY6N3A4_9ALTE|nr:AraC family transcriptional regulator [Alkalimarinus alittae]UZE96482.1 AraC family transcriptional regulator [Alkalimarinus alittae]